MAFVHKKKKFLCWQPKNDNYLILPLEQKSIWWQLFFSPPAKFYWYKDTEVSEFHTASQIEARVPNFELNKVTFQKEP